VLRLTNDNAVISLTIFHFASPVQVAINTPYPKVEIYARANNFPAGPLSKTIHFVCCATNRYPSTTSSILARSMSCQKTLEEWDQKVRPIGCARTWKGLLHLDVLYGGSTIQLAVARSSGQYASEGSRSNSPDDVAVRELSDQRD
jgi:hypothetical protein